MATGLTYAGEFEGKISADEASGFAKAVILTSALVTFTAFLIALHQDLRWYWLLLTVILTGPLFALGSIFIAIGPGTILTLSRSKPSV
jgi:hypothetical protein